MIDPLALVKSITADEINFIAQADYGEDAVQHAKALRHLIFDQDCVVTDEQFWYPYECVELARWTCKDDHMREFAFCNIIIAISIMSGADIVNDPEYMLITIAQEYDKLPEDLREVVLTILIRASEYVKESNKAS
jgi:hypothetical protein